MNEPTTVIQGERYRLMLLTPQLIRLEYAPDGIFEDRPTQKVQNRAFPPVEHRLWRTERGIELSTAFMNVFYDEGPFSYGGLWIENRSECRGNLLHLALWGRTHRKSGRHGADAG